MHRFSMGAALIAGLLMASSAHGKDELECKDFERPQVLLEVRITDYQLADALRVSSMRCTDDGTKMGYHVAGIGLEQAFQAKEDAQSFVTGVRDLSRRCEALSLTREECVATITVLMTHVVIYSDAVVFNSRPVPHDDLGSASRVALMQEEANVQTHAQAEAQAALAPKD